MDTAKYNVNLPYIFKLEVYCVATVEAGMEGVA